MKKIGEGIAQLNLSMNFGEHSMVIHPTLLWNDEDVILVDTGFPGMLQSIRSEMEEAGVPFERLTKVILTHQDYDHIGGLPEILTAVGHPIEVLAHEIDTPYIEGEKLLIKHDPQRGTPPKAKVNTVLQDGDVLPYVGGITVIFTPGHTPGHMSLYHQPSESLITGDATISNEGQLLGPNEAFTPDLSLAWKSIGKFSQFDIQTAICYHGGTCDHGVNEQIKALVAAHS
ncbi:MBL fold metallo-hydrolase [Alicyclobacillus mengziensis]|uniref:MBL fold metallo-hydrolase n=1 Tax=Alicyclobacillus mengziensis TaxID=2931921 RepID=A0A9X7Z7I6_9BACL|nr:MBL fold metallo-hydrolase [Alicyclobacillus mengziensis]QSO47268.1 MBL fold metallo-hydrolase [Alicyclobacillus mengziensis]